MPLGDAVFRVRVSLGEEPGALALLASRCGEAGVNILGMQIFPDAARLDRVTDELVVRVPESWTAREVAELVSGAGADEVSVEPCTTHDLIDQPTRWLSAARDLVADPGLLPVLLERLLGPHPEKWSPTERSRADALAGLAEVVERDVVEPTVRRRDAVQYDATGNGVVARIGGQVVGCAAYAGGDHQLGLHVSPSWRRLGIGTGLLTRALDRAADWGWDEVVLLAPATEDSLLPFVMAAAPRARIRVVDGELQARLSTRVRVR